MANSDKNYKIIFFTLLVFAGACNKQTVEEEIHTKNLCEYELCDARRDHEAFKDIGLLKKTSTGTYHLQTQSHALFTNTYELVCITNGIPLASLENMFVVIEGKKKIICNTDGSPLSDVDKYPISIQKAQPINLSPNSCTVLLSDEYDQEKVNDKVEILSFELNESCLSVLVGFKGGCNTKPEIRMVFNSDGSVKFGPSAGLLAYFVGEIENDCEDYNYQVLNVDLSPLNPLKSKFRTESIELYFIINSQKSIFY